MQHEGTVVAADHQAAVGTFQHGADVYPIQAVLAAQMVDTIAAYLEQAMFAAQQQAAIAGIQQCVHRAAWQAERFQAFQTPIRP